MLTPTDAALLPLCRTGAELVALAELLTLLALKKPELAAWLVTDDAGVEETLAAMLVTEDRVSETGLFGTSAELVDLVVVEVTSELRGAGEDVTATVVEETTGAADETADEPPEIAPPFWMLL